VRAAAWHDAVSSPATGLAYCRVLKHRWQPTMTVEGILQVVMYNMIFCESVFVTTATGPGGMAGPLRIDLSKGRMVWPRVCNSACSSQAHALRKRPVVQEYTEEEARMAFERTAASHRAGALHAGFCQRRKCVTAARM